MVVMQSCFKNEDSQNEIDEKKIKEYDSYNNGLIMAFDIELVNFK